MRQQERPTSVLYCVREPVMFLVSSGVVARFTSQSTHSRACHQEALEPGWRQNNGEKQFGNALLIQCMTACFQVVEVQVQLKVRICMMELVPCLFLFFCYARHCNKMTFFIRQFMKYRKRMAQSFTTTTFVPAIYSLDDTNFYVSKSSNNVLWRSPGGMGGIGLCRIQLIGLRTLELLISWIDG